MRVKTVVENNVHANDRTPAKALQIKMPWRTMIMGEPERLLEWANAGTMTQVHFSDRSIACFFGDHWAVTRGPADQSEASDFVVALNARRS